MSSSGKCFYTLKEPMQNASALIFCFYLHGIIFEIVAAYFYPKPYTSYGEFGRIRGKYPKFALVAVSLNRFEMFF